MRRREARRLLVSERTHERIQAARYFLAEGRAGDAAAIREALGREVDHYARSALGRALAKVDPPEGLDAAGADEDEEFVFADIYAKATQETTKALVHELRRIVGFVRVAAADDVQ